MQIAFSSLSEFGWKAKNCVLCFIDPFCETEVGRASKTTRYLTHEEERRESIVVVELEQWNAKLKFEGLGYFVGRK